MTSDRESTDDPDDVPLVRAILDSVGDAVVECRFIGGTPIVRRANDAFVASFADGEGSARERPLETFVESPRDETLVELQRQETPVEELVTRRTVDGWQPFSVRVLPVENGDPDHPRQVAIYSDRPIRSQYDDKLEALHQATRDLIHQNSRETVARSAVEAAMDVLDLSVTSVHLCDPERDVLAPVAMTERLRGIVGDPPALPLDGSLAGRVYADGDPIVYDDPGDQPGVFNPDTSLQSELILPLGDFGVMMSGSTTPSAFSDRLVWLATILASNTEAALDRIEREETLSARERELTRKNERLEAFARMVSHDLRNPLTVATGRVELAAQETSSDHLQVAMNALDRMSTLIDDLLDLARRGHDVGDVEAVPVADVAADAWSQVRTGDAELVIDDDVGTVSASPSRLAALLENLFRNAVEHAGPTVTVTVGPASSGFYVADDGPGVPDDRKEAVFEIGHSSRTDGTGMGLAIVDEIATAHGWSVSLVDSGSGGTRFEIDVSNDDGSPGNSTVD